MKASSLESTAWAAPSVRATFTLSTGWPIRLPLLTASSNPFLHRAADAICHDAQAPRTLTPCSQAAACDAVQITIIDASCGFDLQHQNIQACAATIPKGQLQQSKSLRCDLHAATSAAALPFRSRSKHLANTSSQGVRWHSSAQHAHPSTYPDCRRPAYLHAGRKLGGMAFPTISFANANFS